MWNTVTAWLAASTPPVTGSSSSSASLLQPLLEFAGAIVGAMAVVYSSRFRKEKQAGQAAAATPVPVPALGAGEAPTLQSIAADQAQLQHYFERRRNEIDERLDDHDRKIDRNGGRLSDIEAWADRLDRRSRWNDDAARDIRRPDDPPGRRPEES